MVTDHGFLNELGYVWQTLSDIDGGGDFLDAHFHLSPHSQSQTHVQQDQEQSEATASPTHISPTTRTVKADEGGTETEGTATCPDSDLE